ncbi:hypothetical protein CVT26_001789 [Gymnopilus dilepis]|uniref:Altered inheritance of mitochondria protein 9, mitochondrial n=1 Tax=Gymnopilus dilepis TaxID=231916 RepID=A0A409VTD1_9AGAR|nr:hypothetical protein CVT26_001789 [Gymnopilus dilepis]
MFNRVSFRWCHSLRLSVRFKSTSFPNPAKYEYLKSCTSKRWMYNDDMQMRLRRLEFDVGALGNAAAKAAGASHWTDMRLIAEGQFNRVLGVTLDNGMEVVARMPFPLAGPARLMTSSEVATMDFLRNSLGAPVPAVLAWNASSENEVGTEYIIMEKCLGETLPTDKPSPGSTILVAQTVMDLLATVKFSQYGSIYYKEDVDVHLQSRPLYHDPDVGDESTEKFRIGPSAERRFYRGGRAQLDIDRGPWTDPLSYIKAVANCEIEWIKAFADQHPTPSPHPAARHISVLKDWLQQAPAVIPEPQYCVATLSHPDMEPSDVFYEPEGSFEQLSYNVTIADWQGASVLPLFETHVPHFVSTKNNYEKMPDNSTKEGDQKSEDSSEERHVNLSLYALVEGFGEHGEAETPADLYAVLTEPRFQQLRQTIYYSSNLWPDNLPRFEKCLIDLVRGYDENVAWREDRPDSPLQYSPEEIEKNQKDVSDFYMKQFTFQRLLDLLESRGIPVGEDGSVPVADYDKAKAEVDKIQEWILSTFPGDEAKASIIERWPFREGRFDRDLQVCK